MTGKMSGTIESARSAAKMSKSIVTVVDSKFISKALAFQVRAAAKMVQSGQAMNEIIEKMDQIRSNTKLFVVVDTLDNLVKGGRIGKGKALIGSLLNIKPIALIEQGEYSPVARVRSQSQALKYLLKEFVEDIKGKTIQSVAVSHADGHELAMKLKAKVEELTGYDKVEIADTTPVISTHTGPGAIGFTYYTD